MKDETLSKVFYPKLAMESLRNGEPSPWPNSYEQQPRYGIKSTCLREVARIAIDVNAPPSQAKIVDLKVPFRSLMVFDVVVLSHGAVWRFGPYEWHSWDFANQRWIRK